MNQKAIWDELYRSNLKWKMEARNLPEALKGKSVLELGAGNGKTLRSIVKQKPKEVVALDFSIEALKSINKDFPKVKTVNADVLELPFKKNKFDIVICYFTLNNLLRTDRKKALDEIHRVLKKSGKLIFQDFATGDFRQVGRKIEENTIEKKNGLACHFFNEQEMSDLLNIFSKRKINFLESSPIKNRRDLKRKILAVEAIK